MLVCDKQTIMVFSLRDIQQENKIPEFTFQEKDHRISKAMFFCNKILYSTKISNMISILETETKQVSRWYTAGKILNIEKRYNTNQFFTNNMIFLRKEKDQEIYGYYFYMWEYVNNKVQEKIIMDDQNQIQLQEKNFNFKFNPIMVYNKVGSKICIATSFETQNKISTKVCIRNSESFQTIIVIQVAQTFKFLLCFNKRIQQIIYKSLINKEFNILNQELQKIEFSQNDKLMLLINQNNQVIFADSQTVNYIIEQGDILLIQKENQLQSPYFLDASFIQNDLFAQSQQTGQIGFFRLNLNKKYKTPYKLLQVSSYQGHFIPSHLISINPKYYFVATASNCLLVWTICKV